MPEISIHAPARGATFTRSFADISAEFQSTLPHGERPISNFVYSFS